MGPLPDAGGTGTVRLPSPFPEGDTLLVRGRIYVGDWRGEPATDAVWVERGVVRATGAEAVALGAAGPVWTAPPGTCLMPGFWDGHIHLADYGLSLEEVPLGGLDDAGAVARRLATAPPEADPLVGRGWMLGRWQGPRPHRHQLDGLGDRAVLLWNHDFHTVWANSVALARAGITAATPDPPGGRIERDPSGEPTGILLDRAAALVAELWPKRTAERLERALLAAQRTLVSLGVTAVCAMGEPADAVRALGRLHATGRLRLRVALYVPLEAWQGLADTGLATGLGDDRLWLGGVKAFLDGALGSQTAWMSEPYDGIGGTGIAMPLSGRLKETLAAIRAAGLRLALHAIGDRAVLEAVDAFAAGRPAHAFDRIEHAQLVTPDAIARWPADHLAASVQPGHLLDDLELMERFWGAARSAHAFPLRALTRRGVPLVFGSDAPVSDPDPLRGVWAAVERRRPDGAAPFGVGERLTPAEALEAYTATPARIEGRPRLGRLTPGSPFDAVLLNRDPLAAGTDLSQLRVVGTSVAAPACGGTR